MNKKILEEFKEKLINEKERIERGLEGFAKKDPKLAGDYNAIFPDFGDRGVNVDESTDEVEEYIAFLDIEHTLELQLEDINGALERIKRGKYGICENCKKKIPVARLEASPEARTCLNCDK